VVLPGSVAIGNVERGQWGVTMQDPWRAYLELAVGATDASRKKASKVVKQLVGKGGATAEQLQALAGDLVATSVSNRAALSKLVRFEVDRALGVVGLATAEEVNELTARVRDLERQLREAKANGAAAETPAAESAPAKKAPARKAPARKAPAKTAAATSAPAKATATKATAKATATKTAAAKAAPARTAAAKKAPAKAVVPARRTAATKRTTASTRAATKRAAAGGAAS
jgi:polyhydroxyalkanoate synthesis regulator phasin